MDELTNRLRAMELSGGGGEEFSQLLDFLKENNVLASKNKIKKAMAACDDCKCLSCPFYADSKKELRRHLRKRKHTKKKSVIKGANFPSASLSVC